MDFNYTAIITYSACELSACTGISSLCSKSEMNFMSKQYLKCFLINLRAFLFTKDHLMATIITVLVMITKTITKAPQMSPILTAPKYNFNTQG